jgi:hypothetical protein
MMLQTSDELVERQSDWHCDFAVAVMWTCWRWIPPHEQQGEQERIPEEKKKKQ